MELVCEKSKEKGLNKMWNMSSKAYGNAWIWLESIKNGFHQKDAITNNA